VLVLEGAAAALLADPAIREAYLGQRRPDPPDASPGEGLNAERSESGPASLA